MSDLELLYKIYPVFKNINDKNENIINNNAQFKTLYADEMISSAKGTCQGILFVMSGCLKIQRINEEGEETSLYDIKIGELCHEALSCMLNYESLNIVGRAIANSKVCIIPMDIMDKYILNNPQFLKYMYSDIHKKFNLIIQKREEKIHDSLKTRLLKLLISKNSKIIYGTHKELAFEIDSTREVVSRNLKMIEKQGYIKMERGKIIVLKDLEEYLRK